MLGRKFKVEIAINNNVVKLVKTKEINKEKHFNIFVHG